MILDAFRRNKRLLNEESIKHRERVRSVYATENGQKELFNLILDCGLLEVIDSDRLATRNWAIKKLEEIGILDENVIRGLIKSYFESNPRVSEMYESKQYKKEDESSI